MAQDCDGQASQNALKCAFATASAAGGSDHPLLRANCRTGARLAQLHGYQDCQEGDLSSPVPPP